MTESVLTLNDGHRMPQLGLGTLHLDGAADVVDQALSIGYRHIDTASLYRNEEAVGRGIRRSSVAREEVFVTSKLHNSDQGYQSTLDAFQTSRALLGLDYLDLYLIHWPAPRLDRFVDSWRALVELRERGWVRSIGVSNFRLQDLDRIITEVGVVPAVNQIELHPSFAQPELQEEHRRLGILTQAWSPLGGRDDLQEGVIAQIADETGRTAAQVIVRWHLDSGRAVFPKSANPGRLRENFAALEFALNDDQVRRIDALDRGNRTGGHPDQVGNP